MTGARVIFPTVGAVKIALAHGAAPKISELLENKRWMIAPAAEVAVPRYAVLVVMSGFDGAVHIQVDLFAPLCLVQHIKLLAKKIGQGSGVVGGGQNPGLNPCRLAG